VKLHLSNDVGSDDRKLQDIREVLGQLDRINSLYLAASHLCYLAEGINVALFSRDGDNAHSNTFLLSIFPKLFIESFCLANLLLSLNFVESTQTNIGKPISAQDHR
jgi:hypothetical protein